MKPKDVATSVVDSISVYQVLNVVLYSSPITPISPSHLTHTHARAHAHTQISTRSHPTNHVQMNMVMNTGLRRNHTLALSPSHTHTSTRTGTTHSLSLIHTHEHAYSVAHYLTIDHFAVYNSYVWEVLQMHIDSRVVYTWCGVAGAKRWSSDWPNPTPVMCSHARTHFLCKISASDPARNRWTAQPVGEIQSIIPKHTYSKYWARNKLNESTSSE